MPSSSRCCAGSPTCRFEWRPAPQLAAGVLVAGLLAMLALCLCELAPAWRAPLMLACGLHAIDRARRWLARPGCALACNRRTGQAWVDGEPVLLQPRWRCGLLQLCWQRGGRWQRRLCLPGQLPAAVIGELRQWPGPRMHSRKHPPVAT